MEVPQTVWFIAENPKMDDLGVSHELETPYPNTFRIDKIYSNLCTRLRVFYVHEIAII